MSEEIEQIERAPTIYVFGLDKISTFIEVLNFVPRDEIGHLSFWNATKINELVFELNDNRLYNYQQVWCLSVDFKPEHQHLKSLAEQESLFYAKDDPENRTLINQFFGSQEKDIDYYNYLASIGK
jgi:hypothetical protein